MYIHRALLRLLTIVTVCLLIFTMSLTAQQRQVERPESHTQVVLLGTGNPPADPDRSGPATAIVVNGTRTLSTSARASCDAQRPLSPTEASPRWNRRICGLSL